MKDDGGQMFPKGMRMGECEKWEGGMTLRDWFAGQALAGILAAPNLPQETSVVTLAYAYGDCMIKERNKE